METTSRGTAVLATLAAAVVGLSACGAPDSEDGAAGGGGGQASESGGAGATPPKAGETPPALDFTTRTVDGNDFAGAELQGKPVVLWFWAPWCTVCRGEAEGVMKAAERHTDDVKFIGVAGRGEVDDMKKFVDDTETDGMTHIVDDDGSIWSGFEVTGQPAFSFLRADGTFHTVSGTLSDADLDGYIADDLTG
ncbi:redoxin domain-containing protein [Nocardiopsis rhodophaea]